LASIDSTSLTCSEKSITAVCVTVSVNVVAIGSVIVGSPNKKM